MIVKMKKVCFVCQAEDAQRMMERVRALGAVHMASQQLPQSKSIGSLEEDLKICASALDILSRYGSSKEETIQKPMPDWKQTSRHIIDLDKRLDQLREYSLTLKNKILDWEPWGDFDPALLPALSEQGVFVRLYEIPVEELKNLPEGIIVRKVAARGGVAYCVAIALEKKEIPWKEVLPPKVSLTAMRFRFQDDKIVERSIIQGLREQKSYYEALSRARDSLTKELEFQRVLHGMGSAGGLSYAVGFAPVTVIGELEAAGRAHQWGMLTQETCEDDVVPTLLRVPAWVSIARPLLNFLGLTPGYRESDISWAFLIFFSIFFGILIGDAGYGVIYLLFTHFVLREKYGRQHSPAITLLYILSCCAIIWGVMSGSFFGQQWLAALGFKTFMPAFNNAKFFQAFCFLLGAAHLSIAHSWRVALRFPSWSVLADCGWILIVWAAFFLAKTLILADGFPAFGIPLACAGAGLVVLFTHPQKNLLKAFAAGMGTIALNLVNSFTDVVSYIRLFAVGMASVAIADATNTMAASSGNGAAAVVIVLIGHALNLIMGPMSVLVHGVRLNVLEFSGHAGVAWSGIEYNPLRE